MFVCVGSLCIVRVGVCVAVSCVGVCVRVLFCVLVTVGVIVCVGVLVRVGVLCVF